MYLSHTFFVLRLRLRLHFAIPSLVIKPLNCVVAVMPAHCRKKYASAALIESSGDTHLLRLNTCKRSKSEELSKVSVHISPRTASDSNAFNAECNSETSLRSFIASSPTMSARLASQSHPARIRGCPSCLSSKCPNTGWPSLSFTSIAS